MARIQKCCRSELSKDIAKIYADNFKFKDFVLKDSVSNNIWFDDNSFAQWHDVDGIKILAILTQDKNNRPYVENMTDESGALSVNNFVLFCKACDIVHEVPSGTIVQIDGKRYQVLSSQRILNNSVWRIKISMCEG